MKTLELENARDYYPSGTETPYSAQSSTSFGGKSVAATTRMSRSSSYDENQPYVEIELDIHDNSVSVYGSKSPDVRGDRSKYEDPENSLLRPGRDRGRSGRSDSIFKRITSSVSNEMKRVASIASSAGRRKPPRPPRKKYRRSKSKADLALKNLKFITTTDGAADWAGIEKQFDQITKNSNGFLHRSQFGDCIGMRSKEFALALFDGVGRREKVMGDSISKEQFKVFWDAITNKKFDSRLQIFFDMVDKDADGQLNEHEVSEIIRISASANNLDNIKNNADEYAALIMEELDPYHFGYIKIESLETLLLRTPLEAVTGGEKTKDMCKTLSQRLKITQSRNPWMRFYRGVKYFVCDNWKRVWVMGLWIGVMAGLFTWKFIEYRRRSAYQVMGVCVCIAKGAGETLKLNMAIILLPVCRNTVTWLRTKTKLNAFVPFDDSLNFHKVIAIAIAVGVTVHATSHLACDFPRLIAADKETYKPMEKYFGKQTKRYRDFLGSVEGVSGIVMVILMTIAFTLASPWFRRNKLKLPSALKKVTGFNAFWYSHHLFVIVYSLLVVHGYYLYLTTVWYKKTTWMYLMVPVVLYLFERLIRALRSGIEAVSILKVAVLPGNVLSLQMSKPQNFKYKSGQYMFLNCYAVSSLEWHPFSITSAPGDDYLSVHIRVLGDWTRQLRSVFSKACTPLPPSENRENRGDLRQQDGIPPCFPRVLIDGPYGAPAQDYSKYDVVLLVGLGIGATPMISIVRDLINNIKGSGDQEEGRRFSDPNRDMLERIQSPNNMVSHPSPARKGEVFRTKRAYFYWVTREQGSFDWFKNVMNEVSVTDRNKVIELHNYCTSVYEEGDARSALITMLQSLSHEKDGVDVVSGTSVISHFAKPKWRDVYKRIAAKHPHTRVGVFYCGAPGLVKELRQLSLDFSRKTTTTFSFHKENF